MLIVPPRTNSKGLCPLLYLLSLGNGTISVTGGCCGSCTVGCDGECFQFEPARPALWTTTAERRDERVSELTGHGAVEHKVNAVI